LARNCLLGVPMQTINPNARLATLDELLSNTVPNFVQPPPSRRALSSWLDSAGIPRFKPNPTAKRGGGVVFYSVSHVERFFRNRTMAKPILVTT
jgi:hypothetical protein